MLDDALEIEQTGIELKLSVSNNLFHWIPSQTVSWRKGCAEMERGSGDGDKCPFESFLHFVVCCVLWITSIISGRVWPVFGVDLALEREYLLDDSESDTIKIEHLMGTSHNLVCVFSFFI